MNRENILRVADAIEKGELVKRGIGFNMADYMVGNGTNPDHIDSCGTTACIAGWAYTICHPEYDPMVDRLPYTIGVEAADFFDLSGADADALFLPGHEIPEDEWTNITPAHAVAVLRHLAETGEVDWSVGAPKP